MLITGAGGFLGNYFVGVLQHLNREQFKKPVTIIALDNFITGVKNSPFFDHNDPNLEFIKHDVMDVFETDKPVDYIMHAAGIASPVFYAKYPPGGGRQFHLRPPSSFRLFFGIRR